MIGVTWAGRPDDDTVEDVLLEILDNLLLETFGTTRIILGEDEIWIIEELARVQDFGAYEMQVRRHAGAAQVAAEPLDQIRNLSVRDFHDRMSAA